MGANGGTDNVRWTAARSGVGLSQSLSFSQGMLVGGEILFWTKVAAIGQVAAALATAGAVIASLWVVLSERAARVTATAGLRLIVPGDGSPAEEVIAIEVTNIGQRPVRVSTIGWRTGWLKRGPKWLCRQYAIQNSSRRRDSNDPPFVLEPGERRIMVVDVQEFQGEEAVRRNAEFFGRIVPLRGLVPAQIRCSICIVGARVSYFNAEKKLAHFLVTGESGAAERFNNAAQKKARA